MAVGVTGQAGPTTTTPQVVGPVDGFDEIAAQLRAEGLGFGSLGYVEAVAGDVADLVGFAPTGLRTWREQTRRYYLRLSPGVVGLQTAGVTRSRDFDRFGDVADAALFDLVQDCDPLDEVPVPGEALGVPGRTITEWSRKSRARFHKRMGDLDYTPMMDAAARGHSLGMVTLTLPCHWQRIAPTSAAFAELVRRFRLAWQKAIRGPLYAVWKKEYQGRGAPHLHLLAPIPARIGGMPGYEWIARLWVRLCAPGGKDHERMLRAHLPSANRPSGCVDFSQRTTDPKRLSVYFGKHAAKTRDSKEYQHHVPEEHQEAAGRFWGYWSLRPAVRLVEVSHAVSVTAKRVLRKIARARQAAHQLRLHAAANIRNESLRRASLQSLRVKRTRLFRSDLGGGWLLVNDGPAVAYALARWLAESERC